MNFSTPTLVINKTISLNNLGRMIGVAKKNNLVLRPHFKTHQSIEIGNWFKEKGLPQLPFLPYQWLNFFQVSGMI